MAVRRLIALLYGGMCRTALCAVLLATLFQGWYAPAQSSANGSIGGTVLDFRGEPVPGIAVVVQSQASAESVHALQMSPGTSSFPISIPASMS